MENFKNPFKKNNDKKEENKLEEKVEESQEENNEAQEEIKQEQQELQEEEKNEFEEKYNDLNNKYLRLAADFDNFRKRTQNEKEELSKYTKASLLKEIITVIDTFDRAQEHLKDIDDSKTLKDGYEMAFKQFKEVLTKLGLVEIEALGKVFNPNEHEAITQVPTNEYEVDTVAYVAQKGYKIEDKVIRAALVGVAKEIEEEQQ